VSETAAAAGAVIVVARQVQHHWSMSEVTRYPYEQALNMQQQQQEQQHQQEDSSCLAAVATALGTAAAIAGAW